MRSVAAALTFGLAAFPSIVHATQSSIPFIDADMVHTLLEISGQGVTVAVIDFGVNYSHPGLIGGIAQGGISIINGVYIPDGGADPGPPQESHGTYMSLIITDSTGVASTAQQAWRSARTPRTGPTERVRICPAR